MYGTTAVIAVEAARRLVRRGARRGSGAAQVFDARDFLDFLRPSGLTWSVTDELGGAVAEAAAAAIRAGRDAC
jgi:hypothetical protein